MKKKLLFLVAIFAVICFIVPISKGGVVYATESLSREFEISEYQRNSNRSIELYEQAMSPYMTRYSATDEKTYSSDFAGVYMDNEGFLNIGIVGLQKTKTGFDGHVKYEKQVFSFNYLLEIQKALDSVMEKFTIVTTSTDEKLNHLSVVLKDEEQVEQIISYLQEKRLYNEKALCFNINFENKTFETSSTAYGGELLFYRNPQPGNLSNAERGTICVNAIDNVTGQFGILTNEHVALTAQNKEILYGRHFNGSNSEEIVIGNNGKGQNWGTVDAAFVPFANQNNWTPTGNARYNTTTYTNVRLGNENQIIQGASVKRIGQTTGITDGQIESTSMSSDGKTNLFKYSNYGEKGDSGGPVYYNDGTNLHLIGMNFSTEIRYFLWFETGRSGVACRISNVMSALNVTPITNDSYTITNLPNGGVRIDSINFNPVGAFVIPSLLNGATVTSIGPSAFANKMALTSVVIPNTVTTIGNSAFSGCTGLSQITIPASVTKIGNEVFQNCIYLERVYIPGGVAEMGFGVFAGSGDVKIYCGAAAKPSGWDANWNFTNRKVMWAVSGFEPRWQQPVWTSSNTTGDGFSHGKITASSHFYNGDPLWSAFNGSTAYPHFASNGGSGWLELKLNYPILIESIDFYQINFSNAAVKGTKNAYFTGTNGIPLGTQFQGSTVSEGRIRVYVGGIITDTVRLNVIDTYSGDWGATAIIINAANVTEWNRPIDGSLIRMPNQNIYMIVGGSPVFLSNACWKNMGSPTNFMEITYEMFNYLPQHPTNGTLVRTPDQRVYKITGGFSKLLTTAELLEMGSPSNFIEITEAMLNMFPEYPLDGSLVRTPNQNIYMIVGGAPVFLSNACWESMGSPTNFMEITTSKFNSLLKQPADGTLIRTIENLHIYIIIAGGSPEFLTHSAWVDMGAPSNFINITYAMYLLLV